MHVVLMVMLLLMQAGLTIEQSPIEGTDMRNRKLATLPARR